MNLHRVGQRLAFLSGAVVGGLALAFLLVLWHPELMGLRRATAPAAPAAAPQPVPAADPGPDAAAAPATSASAIALHSFADAVARAAPAVVNIYTARVVTEQVQPSAFEQLFGGFGPRYRQRVQRALGSGVIVDDAGHVITNNHVIANAAVIKVQLADGRSATAKVVGRDPDTDLAVLEIKLGHLPVMRLGYSDRMRVGDEVLAIGNPLGLQQTVTHGIISATQRKSLGVATFENFIQTDAAINEGNSGGALVNPAGELVGINTAVIAKNLDATGVEGIGFAIPVNLARGVMREILEKGHVVRGWSGIVADDFSDEQAAEVGLARGGVVVTDLYVNGPAHRAGMRRGDVILAIDGRQPRNAQDAMVTVASGRPGDRLKLKVLRGRAETTLEIQLVERPAQA